MKLAAALALVILLPGCAVSPSCFVGVSLMPLGPFIVCGADMARKPKDE